MSERKIVWLASYPKSGNTWVRVLLANYLSPTDQPVAIDNDAAFPNEGPIASSRGLFDELAGVEASLLDAATIRRLRPRVYREFAKELSAPCFMKVHDAWERTAEGEAMFPADVTRGVVYIVRDPLDVAVSNRYYRSRDYERVVADMCDPSYAPNPSPDQLEQRWSDWSGHVRSWLDESGLSVHLVRFEDLKSDAEAALEGILGFCGLPVDGARVRRSVELSSFANLSGAERERGFRDHDLSAPHPFFRSGEMGEGRRELPEHLQCRLIETHRETMTRLGYL